MILVTSVRFSCGTYPNFPGDYVFQVPFHVRSCGRYVVVGHAFVGSSKVRAGLGSFFVSSSSRGVYGRFYVILVFL